MAQKKYVSLSKLKTFLDNLGNKFALLSHKHTLSDITDYTVDSSLSSTSTNPVQNKVLDAEFEAVATAMNALETAIGTKVDAAHEHDYRYYTKTEVDNKLESKSDTTHNHDSAYDTKGSAADSLASAKSYTDTKISDLASTTVVDNKISSHNASTSAHSDIRNLISGLTTRLNTLANSDDDTLDQMNEVVAYIKNNKSLIDGITTSKVNVADIVDNLTTNITNKPLSAAQGVTIKSLIDALQRELDSHTHEIADVSGLQSALDGKANSSHGTHVSYSTAEPVMNGTASAGTASTVSRSDHKHPTDTSRASKVDFDAHVSDVVKHVTNTERENWNAAKTHADSAHAPSDAEKNQNAFSNITVGSTTVSADSATDTVTFVGNNVTITPDATNDKVTFDITKDNVVAALGYTPPTTNTTYSDATQSISGLMSANDKIKLDGVESGANKTVVDSSLDSNSTNPVQNKVINDAINNLSEQIGSGSIVIDLSNSNEGEINPVNADTLGGIDASQYVKFDDANELIVRNILDNSDFTNPVNQRGETSYSGSKYTIDRWKSNSGYSVVTINSDSLNLKSSNGNAVYLQQYIEDGVIKNGNKYTVACTLKDGSVHCATGVASTNMEEAIRYIYVNNDNLGNIRLKYDSYFGLYMVMLSTSKTDGIDVANVVLYEGEYDNDTLPEYKSKGYSAELLECSRYFVRSETTYKVGATYNTENVYYVGFTFPLLARLRVDPTVTVVSAPTNIRYDTTNTTLTSFEFNQIMKNSSELSLRFAVTPSIPNNSVAYTTSMTLDFSADL